MNLQTALIIIGVSIVIVLFMFNVIQERRAKQQMQLPDADIDPLEVSSTKPANGNVSIRRSKTSAKFDGDRQRTEPSLAGLPSSSEGNDVRVNSHDDQEPDLACEAVIDLTFNAPVMGSDLKPFILSLRHVGSKTMHVYALTADNIHRAKIFETESYLSLHVAVLLANRAGPIKTDEWAEALKRVQVLAEQFGGTVAARESVDVLKQALELDRVCASLDMQIGLTLLPRDQNWASPNVVKAALELGAVGVQHGRIVWIDNEDFVRFSLARADQVSLDSIAPTSIAELSFILDAPRVRPDSNAFSRMANIAVQLADLLNAELVDDNRRPLHEGAISFIDQQLVSHFQRLEQSGLQAGSERSLKVFN